jgi:hypothetical protein
MDLYCLEAVQQGNLDQLIWLRSEGFSWDERVCLEAVKHQQKEIIAWLSDHECPCRRAYH